MGRPMPDSLRSAFRAAHHPARSVDCPRCGALPDRPCRSARRVQRTEPHPSRITAWATERACCPACQVEPGIPCHLEGRPYRDHVHPQRETEARRAAA